MLAIAPAPTLAESCNPDVAQVLAAAGGLGANPARFDKYAVRRWEPAMIRIADFSDLHYSCKHLTDADRCFSYAVDRALALYLTQHSGRHYATLFSDEADGSLDPQRKRMFMDMKREVLRLGGYAREFFVSQTPELTALADAVIDLDAWAVLR